MRRLVQEGSDASSVSASQKSAAPFVVCQSVSIVSLYSYSELRMRRDQSKRGQRKGETPTHTTQPYFFFFSCISLKGSFSKSQSAR